MKVRQYNSDGIYLRTYETLSDAARAVKTYAGNITSAIKFDIKSKGYYWKKDEGRKHLKIVVRNYRRGGKQILIYKNKKFFCETSTITEAEDITGVPESTIRNSCKGKELLNRKYKFEYKEKNPSKG